MRTLPVDLLPFIVEFQPFFSKSVWENAQVLLTGAILAIGKRTVTACLLDDSRKLNIILMASG